MAIKACRECGKEVSTEAKTCPHCGTVDPVRKKMGAGGGCLLLIVVATILYMFGSSGMPKTPAAPAGPSIKEQAMQGVRLDFTWTKDPDINVMMANFTIDNQTRFMVRDVEITCVHSGPSGTRIDQNVRTIYENFPPKKKRRFQKFNMGFIHSQAASSSCSITDLKAG